MQFMSVMSTHMTGQANAVLKQKNTERAKYLNMIPLIPNCYDLKTREL